MESNDRVEETLEAAIVQSAPADCPPRLASAMRYALFPGGARIRPRLCLAVAAACGETDPMNANTAGAAIEILHCASLVHDDLPCFDDADMRRGKPSVHRTFGERIAVLAGDALIVLAFETLARNVGDKPELLAPLLLTIGRSVSVPSGIVAGQAWECESRVDTREYHRAKTGALFAAATEAGALSAGRSPGDWRVLGERIGEAFQVADDLHDVASDSDDIGKPTGRDLALGRPSAVQDLGLHGAIKRLENLVANAVASVPACPGQDELRKLITVQARQFMPRELQSHAA